MASVGSQLRAGLARAPRFSTRQRQKSSARRPLLCIAEPGRRHRTWSLFPVARNRVDLEGRCLWLVRSPSPVRAHDGLSRLVFSAQLHHLRPATDASQDLCFSGPEDLSRARLPLHSRQPWRLSLTLPRPARSCSTRAGSTRPSRRGSRTSYTLVRSKIPRSPEAMGSRSPSFTIPSSSSTVT